MDNEVVSKIMHKAKQHFLDQNRDLVASVRGGANELFAKISADMSLDEEAEIAITEKYNEMTTDESDVAGDALTHKNRMVRTAAQGFLEHAFHKQICLAFLRLHARGAIAYAIAPTAEAKEQEFQLAIDAGCRLPQATIERQAQAQTTAEDLDAEITADWNGRLRTDQIRAKKQSNLQYGARLDQMLEEGKL